MGKPQQQTGSTGQQLIKGAALLGGAAVVSKLLGTLQKIPLQNIAGDGVFGIYNAVYPVYILILTLATAGFPIAVSKFVFDHAARGETEEARRVLKTAAALLAVAGLAGFAGLYFGAGAIASLLGMAQAEPAVRSVSYALLVAPVMAALRGYFQGYGDMIPTAVSQVAEQTVRVAVMIALLLTFVSQGFGAPLIAAGATFGSAAGAAAGLLVMLLFWLGGEKRAVPAAQAGAENAQTEGASSQAQRETIRRPAEPLTAFIRRFAAYAVPVSLGTIAMPVLTIVDAVTVPRLLIRKGLDEAAAVHAFGVYNHGLPLVQLVLMIATSMSAALVPAIAGAYTASSGLEQVRGRASQAVRFAWVIGLAASFGLAAVAAPLNVMFFKSAEGSSAVAIVAFSALFGTLQIVCGSVLQGLGAVHAPARSLFIAAVVKAAGNLLLVPLLSIDGAAVAAVAAYAAAAALNLAELRRILPLRRPLRATLGGPLAAALAMSAAVLLVAAAAESALSHGLPALSFRLRETAVALLAVAGGAAAYPAALLLLGAVTAEDIRALPAAGPRAAALLIKLRLLRESTDTYPISKV